MFIDADILGNCGWQAFERIIARLLIHKGFSGVRVVGGSGDRGADIIAIAPNKKRWLIQAKYWSKLVPESELRKTLDAARAYKAHNSVVVALRGVDDRGRQFQRQMLAQGASLTIWGTTDLIAQAQGLKSGPAGQSPEKRDYQEAAISAISQMLANGSPRRGMVVMATGLGKTFTAAEAVRRCLLTRRIRVLVLAHTNPLTLQLERAFWPFVGPTEPTIVWNQHEKPSVDSLNKTNFVFGTRDSVYNYINAGGEVPRFDLILIDECHHANSLSSTYQAILAALDAGTSNGPQLLGLTATPFMTDPEARLDSTFGATPMVSIDMVYGLQKGFLSEVDYRLFTDNINWDALNDLRGEKLSPKSVNRTFFIAEWDDGVIEGLQKAWAEVPNPKAIVFCGTIEHALLMRDKINARGFCRAECIYSGVARGETMSQYRRNLVLADFEAGDLQVICVVDVFNEGIDVPDVNIVVFNRITHSRRIFIQQLGRGLRITADKKKCIVLDFAQDVRRFAACLKIKGELAKPVRGTNIVLGNKVVFQNAGGDDPRAEAFLKAWLTDVEAIEAAGDDEAGVLQFPPALY